MAPRGVHYLMQAAEGGLGAKQDCNWSNSALIDVKNPPNIWLEEQRLDETRRYHRGVLVLYFPSFFISLFKCLHSAVVTAAVNALSP